MGGGEGDHFLGLLLARPHGSDSAGAQQLDKYTEAAAAEEESPPPHATPPQL